MHERSATSRTCPKCGHLRSVADEAPAWQCPACGIAYDKYASWLERRERAGALLRPRRHEDPVPPVELDASVWSLVVANTVTLAIALWQGWTPHALMPLYWAQSVAIGCSYMLRMLALERFSTEGFRINGEAVSPTPATKRQTAAFFAMHYGMFHVVYLVFLIAEGDDAGALDGWFAVCVLLFVLNHAWSHRYNLALDRRGTPNIGTLMATPYLRIVPMHLTIIFGGITGGTTFGLVLFVTLKTVADVGMHLVEHRRLRRTRAG